ncbi:MAG: pentapeptide repeat-containing protein [Cyanobacteria bacterium J06635_10]
MGNRFAIRRINSFEKSFGKSHLYLAYHAAFPLALTPELLYHLWANFQQDIDGEAIDIPWVAVGDILLSNLCEEVGNELYEMDVEIRSELLQRLKQDPKFGQQRIIQLSDFLLQYVQQQLKSDDIDIREFAKVQKWTALAYTQPSEVAHQIAQHFQSLQIAASTPADEAEFIRMASLLETFVEPLVEAQLEPLLVYARGMASFARGDLEEATEQLGKVTENGKVHIAGVDLAIPESVQENADISSIPKGQDFSGKKLRGKSFKGQDLTGADFSYTDIRSTDFSDAKLIGANFSNAVMGLQRRWAIVLILYAFLLSLLAGVASSLIGLFLGSFTTLRLGLPTLSNNRFGIYYFTLITCFLGLFVFITAYLVNIRKRKRAILISITSFLCLAPTCVATALLIISYSERKSLFVSRISTELIIFASIYIGCIIFAVICFLTLGRGIRAFWGTAALAIGGTYYCGFIVVTSLSNSSSTQQTFPQTYNFWIAALAVILVAVMTFVSFANQTSQRHFMLLISILILAATVNIGQTQDGAKAVIAISWSAIALVSTLASISFAAKTKTLKQALIFSVAFILFISLITGGFLLSISIPSSDTFASLLIVAVFTIPGNVVSTLSGIAALRSSMITTVAMYITWALYLASIASREALLPAIWAEGLTSVFAVLLAVALAWAMIITMAFAIAFVWVDAQNFAIAVTWVVAVASCVGVIFTLSLVNTSDNISLILSDIGAATVFISITGQSIYIAWLALIQKDTRFSFIRDFAISLAARGGTSFRNADLSKANFDGAILKSADFREANLTHTSWLKAKKLSCACVENTYLQYPKVQKLAITGETQNQNFDNLNLQGINLREANLVDVSFIGANLSQANLRGANLSRARLIDINLEATDLTGACLTGAYIQNLKISNKTKFDIISCQYCFWRLPTHDETDPLRFPEDYHKTFAPGEFTEMIKKHRKLNPEFLFQRQVEVQRNTVR